jgi:hypothetical protein
MDDEEVIRLKQSYDTSNIAFALLHDIESPRRQIAYAIDSLERQLTEQHIRLADNPFEFINFWLDEMNYIVQTYSLISHPRGISPSKIYLNELLSKAIRSARRRPHSGDFRKIIMRTSCEMHSLLLDERLFYLALRCLLSLGLGEFSESNPGVVEVTCQIAQNDFMLQFSYGRAYLNEKFREFLSELLTNEKNEASDFYGRSQALKLEFARHVIAVHGGNIRVTNNPHAILVTIELPVRH